jgi:hypothetical protein
LLVAALLVSLLPGQGMTLALRKTFVEKYKDQVTITTTLRVDKHHDRPNDVDEDGDVHMAGRDSVIKLPLVAEILNGRKERDTLDFLLSTSAGQQVETTGVWRLWFEHPGSEPQVQGKTVKKPTDSNPDHLFELHPLTKFGEFDCLNSFLPIVGDPGDATAEFRGYPATTTFPYYEARKVKISRSKTAIMLNSTRAFYNYTEFFIKLTQTPKDVGDGYMVAAKISDSKNFSDEVLVPESKRMIFAKGSEPANKVKNLKVGAKLHVLGIPRVNLSEVFEKVNGLDVGEEQEIKLPYEMIVVAILPNK